MADPWHHAVSSARRFGGEPTDYLAVHAWFDGSKSMFCDQRHRALRHHAEGIAQAIEIFGHCLTIGGKEIPVRWIGEQHVSEDLGRIPNFADWMRCTRLEKWMISRAKDLTKV